MTELRLFICDGCDERRAVAPGIRPAPGKGWKTVALEWEGLAGYPTSLPDGRHDLHPCPSCAVEFKRRIKHPRLWPRAEKSEAAS